jgi:hypothetical protein
MRENNVAANEQRIVVGDVIICATLECLNVFPESPVARILAAFSRWRQSTVPSFAVPESIITLKPPKAMFRVASNFEINREKRSFVRVL